ncbi:MAG: hypothetical protein SFU83_18460 [Meiothermus sp.]|nr:hypothetical protein [Meiothermus sp.]
MKTVLACAARLEHDFERFRQLHPGLLELYSEIHLACRAETLWEHTAAFRALRRVHVTVAAPGQRNWRFLTVQKALEFPCDLVHYADFDHLLRWSLNSPAELAATLEQFRRADCTLVGRSPASMARYARAITETEAVVNQVLSHLLGHPTDVCSGTRGFSRRAAEHLVAHSRPENDPLGTDAEWPVLLHAAGFAVRTVWVDGLSWLLPTHQGTGDDEASQRQREAYDQDPTHWAFRVQVARRIVGSGLEAFKWAADPARAEP